MCVFVSVQSIVGVVFVVCQGFVVGERMKKEHTQKGHTGGVGEG